MGKGLERERAVIELGCGIGAYSVRINMGKLFALSRRGMRQPLLQRMTANSSISTMEKAIKRFEALVALSSVEAVWNSP